jgi:hypothetical protein
MVGSLQIIKEDCIPPLFKLTFECTMLQAELSGVIFYTINPVAGAFSMSLAIGSAVRIVMPRFSMNTRLDEEIIIILKDLKNFQNYNTKIESSTPSN